MGSIRMKFVSYYTDLYSLEAEGLIKTLKQFSLNYAVHNRPQLGSWERNTQYKAPFILEMLSENDSIIWTDADSRIRQYPELFNLLDCDVAFFFFHDHTWKLPPQSKLDQAIADKDGYLQSGTMYFKNTPATISLVKRWIELNEEDHTQWDQWNIQRALYESKDLRVDILPPEYVWIDNVSHTHFPNKKPIIEHLQASRKYKTRLNRS